MKPLSLKISAFASYINEQYIDFTSFSEKGLFLICGETGAGKTALLDAITYALYGKSSGDNRGDLISMRCQFAKTEQKTYIEFIFQTGMGTYKFTRGLREHKKRSGEISFETEQAAFFKNPAGEFEPIFENPKKSDLENKACEIIGLNYEQFRQVIILPQGQFERFLLAPSKDKEKILISLFDAEKWNRVAEVLKQSINSEKQRLEIASGIIKNTYKEYPCEDFEKIKELLSEKTAISDEKFKEKKQLEKSEKKAQEEFVKSNAVNNKFSELEKSETKLKELELKVKDIDELKERVSRGKNAEALKPLYDSYEELYKVLSVRKCEVENAEKEHEFSMKELTEAEKLKSEICLLAEKNEMNKHKHLELCSLRETYENIDRVFEEMKAITEKYTTAKVETDEGEIFQKKLNEERFKLDENVADLRGEYSKLFDLYKLSIGGQLAKELKRGEPCPVCGSSEHPKPAKAEEGTSEKDLTKKEKELKKAEKSAEEKEA